MSFHHSWKVAALVVFAVSSASAAQPKNLDARVEQIVTRSFPEKGPGAAVLVVYEGKVVHRRGYGLANVEKELPINSHTAFDLASVSKQFTAMEIMILQERGKLKFNDPIGELLPRFAVPERGRPVRVEDLLWHTSGLADYTGAEWNGTDEEFRDLTTAAHVKWMSGTKARRAPGIMHEYNNSGYALLAQIVQSVSKQSYSEFLTAEIFKPLGMTGTVVVDNLQVKVPHMALGYKVNRKSGVISKSHSPSVICGDGNIFSTIDDLAKWDAALRDNKLVKPALLKRAFTSGTLDNGKAVDYGYGWSIERYGDNLLWVGHSGSWAGTATYISRYVDEDITVVVLSNDENAPVSKIGDKIAELFDE